MRIISLIIGLVLSLADVAADTIDGYTFFLDGKPLDPGLICVNGGVLSPGDIVYIEDMPLCLDEPGVYKFQLKEGIIRRTLKNGQSHIVACEIFSKYDEGVPVEKWPLINPLAGMDDAALKMLRGVTISTWSDEIGNQLEKLDLNHVCLSLQMNWAADDLRVPPIPEGVRTLILENGGGGWFQDKSRFMRLKKVRFLSLKGTSPLEFDFSILKGMPLEYLSLPWTDNPKNVDVLGTFTELKTLAANHCSFMGDGRWLGRLTNLRTLYASHLVPSSGEDMTVTALDLEALAGLTKLEAFHVQSTPVKSLPTSRMPSLKQASLLRSNAPSEMVDAFARANPQAIISRSMNAQLAAELAKADRVLVRTGGVSHGRPSVEKTIHESRDRGVITELAAHFVVDEAESGGCCMCGGNPTFEFYRNDKLVAMIAFHHGRSIRWADGTWPGDGMLTEQSSSYLVDWLAKQHFTGPQTELFEGRRRAAALQRRNDRYQALLPTVVWDALVEADALDELTAVFEKNVPDVKTRALLYLRLFGCEDSTWALSAGLDQSLIETWLPGIPAATLREVILAAPPKSEEGLGVVRWIFGEGHVGVVKDDEVVLKALAQFALTHPRQSNRWRTLSVLRDLGTPAALNLLRTVMKEGTKPRELGEDQTAEPGGQRTFHPGAITLPDGTPDKIAAALCLSLIDDEASRSEIETLRDGLSEEVRNVWDKSMSRKQQR